jgi:transposase-like protein
VREYCQDQQDLSDNGITHKELKAENRRLKQENKRPEMEREILKKPRPSLRKSRVEIRLHPAGKEGLSRRLHSTLGYQTPLAYEKEHCRMAAQ